MLKPGDRVELSVDVDGTGQTTYHNMEVVECDDGLLKVRDSRGQVTVYNMRSTAFLKATLHK